MSEGRPSGTIGAVTDLASKVATTLTPQYLGLLLVNIVFILGLFWYANHLRADRIALFTRLLDACLATVEHSKDGPGS